MSINDFTQEEIDEALRAMIAYAGNAKRAQQALKDEGKAAPHWNTLYKWCKTTHWERYEQLREQFFSKMEEKHANDLLDRSRRANEVVLLAIEKAQERLENGKDQDPGRTAANLARVDQSSIEKRLALQGRPSRIVENRNPEEIARALVAMGVLKVADAPELEAGDDPEG